MSVFIGAPHVSIGINLPVYPQLVAVPGYPVYYAPRLNANYFFYDGMYWVYQDDNWYASSWYNGPWGFVEPYYVPLFVLRVPVRYYRQPPVYFRGWPQHAPPRWGHHWGPEWERQRSGWDQWQRSSVPKRAPLPTYQRQYSGEKYPQVEKQHEIRSQQYRYQPREKAVREHFQQLEQRAPAPAQREREDEPRRTSPRQEDDRDGVRSQPQQRGPVIQEQRQQPDAVQREQKGSRSKEQEKEEEQERRDKERGRGRN
ncbi:MAG: hypothetical protein ACYC4A_06360 [Desulfobulbia bacterium]